TPNAQPVRITLGPDGNLWFTEAANQVGRITPDGTVSEFTVPTFPGGLRGITAGPDGNVWFTEASPHHLGRLTPDGTVTEFAGLTAGSNPKDIVTGPDGNLWFTEYGTNRIGRLQPYWVVTAQPAGHDPLQGALAAAGAAAVSPQDGSLHAEHPL